MANITNYVLTFVFNLINANEYDNKKPPFWGGFLVVKDVCDADDLTTARNGE